MKRAFKVGEKVLLWNLRRADRKGGKMSVAWLGPYTVAEVFPNSVYSVTSLSGVTLKHKVHGANLKPYITRTHQKEVLHENEEEMNTDISDDRHTNHKEDKCTDGSDFEMNHTNRSDFEMNHTNGSDFEMNHTNHHNCQNKSATNNSEQEPGEASSPSPTVLGEDPGLRLRFVPTNAKWREMQCKKLGLGRPQKMKARRRKESLGQPLETEKIIGDGNCFFRAVSKEITGSQSLHTKIREAIIEVFHDEKRKEHLRRYCGTDTNDYLIKTKMAQNGIWATDVEIMATAMLLNTTINVYTQTGQSKSWFPYEPFTQTQKQNGEMIYFTNLCSHFERVLRVDHSHHMKTQF